MYTGLIVRILFAHLTMRASFSGGELCVVALLVYFVVFKMDVEDENILAAIFKDAFPGRVAVQMKKKVIVNSLGQNVGCALGLCPDLLDWV